MSARIVWSGAQDATVRRMRTEGATWDAIAAALGVSRWCASERGRKIGALLGAAQLSDHVGQSDPNRDALPAGHPTSWGAIAAGPYPMSLR